jgi:two-component system chemotaxis sensor kinase CheA
MAIDITQFHSVFFEESLEGLETMGAVLLNEGFSETDGEAINTLFRAAHSIKGGAGTFGFIAVADFTHVIESLLERLRIGECKMTTEMTKVLLESVYVTRNLLSAAQNKSPINQQEVIDIKQKMTELKGNSQIIKSESEIAEDETNAMHSDASKILVWNISFRPHLALLQMGNDPIRMFQELAMLGDLTVVMNDDQLPSFSELEPDDCYLAWDLTLTGEVGEQEIREIFEWVEGECELSIDQLSSNLVDSDDAQIQAEPAPVSPNHESSEKQTQKSHQKQIKKNAVTSMRVDIDKADALVDLVGELVITQSMLSQLSDNFSLGDLPKLHEGIEQLERHTRDMQEAIMQIRMLPISTAFNRLPRIVHDLSLSLGKKVNLKFLGENTELDKTVLENMADPLVHLVRNALDHGLETPEERKAADKSDTGLLLLNAYHQGGNIIIEISDDGAGIDDVKVLQKAISKGLVSDAEALSREAIQDLIFNPGFSTADRISEISGGGVGTDVVRENINNMGGSVGVSSTLGEGTTFTLRLPLTLAIMDGQTIKVAGQDYILPLTSIIESFEIEAAQVKQVSERGELYLFRGDYIPILRLYQLFNLPPTITELTEGLLVIVDAEGQKVGLFIDDLISQQQVVIKNLEKNYRKVLGFSGATIMGDGTVSLILDISGLIKLYKTPSLAKLPMVEEGGIR